MRHLRSLLLWFRIQRCTARIEQLLDARAPGAVVRVYWQHLALLQARRGALTGRPLKMKTHWLG